MFYDRRKYVRIKVDVVSLQRIILRKSLVFAEELVEMQTEAGSAKRTFTTEKRARSSEEK